MHTDKVMPTYRKVGETKHYTRELVALYTDTPAQTIVDLRRMAMTADIKSMITTEIPGIGKVTDVPMIQLSPSAIMLVGETWIAVLDLMERK